MFKVPAQQLVPVSMIETNLNGRQMLLAVSINSSLKWNSLHYL